MPMPDNAFALTPRQRWALPGSSHDLRVRIARVVLPMTVGVLTVFLIAAPLVNKNEVSFVLARDTVSMAKERLRVTAALYRGEDGKGQPFSLRAGSAIQTTAKDPVVKMTDLRGEIRLDDGPAQIAANAGRYNMDSEIVSVDGPVRFNTSDGYTLLTRDVSIGLKSRIVASDRPVTGQMPLGRFSAGRFRADLSSRTVVLDGRARLHIVQGAVR
jgi:lipopolysaccharide export system protein LptC